MNTYRYINPKRIEFVITYQCSGHCKHCSLGDRSRYAGGVRHIDPHRAARVVEELAQMFPLSSVMTFGGEPLLYADAVCAVHTAATRGGVGTRQLITNGYFTRLDGARRQTAAALREAGVNNLLLSVDAFHQETIPLAAVRHFAECIKEAGIPNVRLHPAWVVNEAHDNPYNAKTKEHLAALRDLEIPVSRGNNIILAGNAASHLARYYDSPRPDGPDACGSMPYTEPLNNITSLSIIPNGDVMICGFVIGSIHRQSMEDILAGYDPCQNQWMRAILTEGRAGLLSLARQKGLDIAQNESICDLCYKINNVI